MGKLWCYGIERRAVKSTLEGAAMLSISLS